MVEINQGSAGRKQVGNNRKGWVKQGEDVTSQVQIKQKNNI